MSEPVAGFVCVATQIDYALGILLLVPPADVAEPRRLLRWLIVATAAGLLAAAAAPVIWVLVVASLVFAAATVVPQILVPLATSLVPPEHRARVIAALFVVLPRFLPASAPARLGSCWLYPAGANQQGSALHPRGDSRPLDPFYKGFQRTTVLWWGLGQSPMPYPRAERRGPS